MITINYLTAIELGSGAVQRLPQVLAELGIKRPMLVTDAGIVRAGILARISEHLSADQAAVVFTDTPPNPTEEAVEAAAAFYKQHACDGLVAIGAARPSTWPKAWR